MQELIERLRAQLDQMPGGPATQRDLVLIRGCHDLLLAMEERLATVRYHVQHPTLLNEQGKLALLERA